MDIALLQHNAIGFLWRWIHIMSGVTWIGLLYYFNFIQGSFFAEAAGPTKSEAVQKLVPRALWWFRWSAMLTFISGAAMLWVYHLTGFGILVGATMGSIMFLNVWLIIWPNQKIVIASAEQVAGGGEAMPAAAGAGAKAGLASRTNTLFSIPMLFFMASSRHLPAIQDALGGVSMMAKVLVFGLIAVLALNGIKGKTGPMTSVKGVVSMGFLLTLVLYLFVDLL